MIEVIGGLPENVVAIMAKDRITRQDYESVLIPAVNDVLKRHGKIRLYMSSGPSTPGSMPALPGFLLPGRMMVFTLAEKAAAREWIGT